jgi:hypothetical protein
MTARVMLPEPIEIDLAPCELCGYAIEDLEELIYLRAADLVAQWERADPRDAWRHTGENPPRLTAPSSPPVPYRTPQATMDAFWYVVGLKDSARLSAWLRDHPRDTPFLLALLEAA